MRGRKGPDSRLGDPEGASRREDAVRLPEGEAVVRAHEGQAEHGDVHGHVRQRHVRHVARHHALASEGRARSLTQARAAQRAKHRQIPATEAQGLRR